MQNHGQTMNNQFQQGDFPCYSQVALPLAHRLWKGRLLRQRTAHLLLWLPLEEQLLRLKQGLGLCAWQNLWT
jgi:hypothetical protein